MNTPVLADIASRIVLIVGLFMGIQGNIGLHGVLWVVTAGNALQLIILWFVLRRTLPIRLAFDFAIWRSILEQTWPIALSICLNLIYLRADTLILSLVAPKEVVGWYGAAYQVWGVLISFPVMFVGLTLASFTRAWNEHDLVSFGRYLQKSFDAMMLGAIPLIVGTYFVATPVMVLVSGPAFAPAGDMLRILILACGIFFVGTLFSHLINVLGLQRRMVVGYCLGAVIGLGGYLIFIPRFSYWGGAWVTVATELFVAIFSFVLVQRRAKIRLSIRSTVEAIGASVVMGGVLFVGREWPLLLQLFVAPLAYGLTLLALGGPSRSYLLSLLPSKRAK